MTYNGALLFNVEGPLLVPLPQGSIRAGHFLNGFKDIIKQRGRQYNKILDDAGIDIAAVDDPDYPLSGTSATAMLERCSDLLEDDLFGLHLAEYQDAEVYGCLSVLGRSAPTLKAGLESIIEFLPLLHSPGADAELVTQGNFAEYRWRPYADFSYHEQALHHGLLLAAKLVASLGGRNFRPSYVTSMTNMRRHHDQFEHKFGCAVHGRSMANAIGFDASYLDRPLPTSNPIIFGLVASYLEQVKDVRNPSLLEQIEGYIGNTFRTSHCTIDHCALRLNTSTRTLQKRLNELGTTFADIIEAYRFKSAKNALLETQYTLDEIADYLGYSEKSSFCRAFKRWTSVTPQAFRESQGRNSAAHN